VYTLVIGIKDPAFYFCKKYYLFLRRL